MKIQSLDTYFHLSQRKWIQDDSPLKLVVKSRQTGFSFCNCFRLVRLVSADDVCHGGSPFLHSRGWTISIVTTPGVL